MQKSYFLKKQLPQFLSAAQKAIARLLKKIFAKRTLLIVTDKKIRTVNFGLLSQVAILFVVLWVGNLFLQSLRYDELIVEKANEIAKLKDTNEYFEEEISTINEKLQKLSEYFTSVNGLDHNVKAKEIELKVPQNIKEDDLSRKDKRTFNQIKEVTKQMQFVQDIAESRIKKIEEVIANTGLNIKKMPLQNLKAKVSFNQNQSDSYPQGGPLEEGENSEIDSIVNKNASNEDLERNLEKQNFANEIDYLIALEKIVQVMPLGKPMKNYFISSGFGASSDPFHKSSAMHMGLDFVGVTNEKIISPSQGKVILAGKFSNYGNAVVIDHGFGLTTRYGHLSEVKVKEGQIVKKGEVIALQGSTGRSTGAHLHYEVRYKNTPLNPKRFLEAGETLFKDRNLKYVNS